VHPIDLVKHPTWGLGFRWCVSLGDDPLDEAAMLQAGVAESEAAACRDGDMYAAAVVNAFRLVGVPVVWEGPTTLVSDPLPADKVA
jgi:hypothetical protein